MFGESNSTGKFKILGVQNIDLLIIILPKISFGPAQTTKLHVSLLCQVVQNTGEPKIQNTDGARATWGWVINPLVPAGVPGHRKPDSQSVWVLPYIGIWFSSGFWYRADF